jgi:peptidoglycan/xylan/chitin deacetylase (PgdA/CDA1 family)
MIIAPVFYFFAHLFAPSGPTTAIVPVTALPVTDTLVKYVYLSFDDGPLQGTANCVAICAHQKVEASFFEIGLHQSRSAYARNMYSRIQNDSAFALCNHSYSHANGKYVQFYHQPDTAFADFMLAKNILRPKNNIIRLPGNNAWNTNQSKRASGLVKPIVHKLDSAGFNIIGWDLEWHFNKKGRPVQSAQRMANLVDTLFAHNQTMTKNHLVILMHDHMFGASADSAKLATMVALLKANPHYQFRKITQYPGLKNGGR